MGSRKHIMAEQYKAEKKQKAIAILNDCPTSPLKMRIVADTIRGVEINRALGMLRFSKKAASIKLEKLLRSAIANWEQKNEGQRLEDNKLCVSEIFVNGGDDAQTYPGCAPGSRPPHPQALEQRDDRGGQNGS